MMLRNLLIVGFLSLGVVSNVQAEVIRAYCEGMAAARVGEYVFNASAAKKGWEILKGYDNTHLPVLGYFRKEIRENGVWGQIKDHIKSHKTNSEEDNAPLEDLVEKAIEAAFESQYGSVRDGWDMKDDLHAQQDSKNSESYQVKNVATARVGGNFVKVEICTKIVKRVDSWNNVPPLTVSVGYRKFDRERERGRLFEIFKDHDYYYMQRHNPHRICTTWKYSINTEHGSTVETTMGDPGVRSNHVDGSFMSFKDYILENRLLPKACEKFFKYGQKAMIADETTAAIYRAGQQNVKVGKNFTFVDSDGELIRASGAR